MSPLIKKRFFNNRFYGQAGSGAAGFTLLEVMIAVAVIAIAFVTLLGAQSQSVSIATGSRFNSMASMLAQRKLAEVEGQKYELLNSDTGDFGEDFPGYRWKTQVEELGESDTGIKGANRMLKTVDLTVSIDQDAALSYELRTIVCKKMETVK